VVEVEEVEEVVEEEVVDVQEEVVQILKALLTLRMILVQQKVAEVSKVLFLYQSRVEQDFLHSL
jgi:hypothetical protein